MVLRDNKYKSNKRVLKKRLVKVDGEVKRTEPYGLWGGKYFTDAKDLKTFEDQEGKFYVAVTDDSHFEKIDKKERSKVYNIKKQKASLNSSEDEDTTTIAEPRYDIMVNKRKKFKKPKIDPYTQKPVFVPEPTPKELVNKAIQEEERLYEESQMNKENAKKVRVKKKVRGNLNHMLNKLEFDHEHDEEISRGMHLIKEKEKEVDILYFHMKGMW